MLDNLRPSGFPAVQNHSTLTDFQCGLLLARRPRKLFDQTHRELSGSATAADPLLGGRLGFIGAVM
jgi:hypothetical protein